MIGLKESVRCFLELFSVAVLLAMAALNVPNAYAKKNDANGPLPHPDVELAPIPSNFDIKSELVPTWGSGAVPPSAAPDVVGAFRFICSAGQISFDDPIVYPGQPGKSHLHQFFGNTSADASSTYVSLRSSGDSTCTSRLNRSAYWMPAMMNGRGQVVRPDYVSIYYKRRPANDPECKRQGTACVGIPRGLRFIFGFDMLNHKSRRTGGGYFNCDGPTGIQSHYPSIVDAAKNCPIGNKLGAVISAPECWNGKNLDSPNHRSHVSYGSYGEDGGYRCPPSHPFIIPTFTLGAWYSVDETLDRSGKWNGAFDSWHLSSDNMPGMPMKPGTSFHSDWFGAWDDDVMKIWTDNCINKLLNCSGGDLGNGQQMKMFKGFKWTANPHLAEPPPSPETPTAHDMHAM
ncbi:MAG: DUF1996 domain-containing protein [Sphingomonadales bacterium]|nr:DUF1996 domain-containing protein [Sphingomonadales bacterium]